MNDQKSLKKSAQSVQDALDAKNIKASVIELPSSTRTAQDAAQSINCEIGQIVKSLIFKTKNSGEPILILASGPNRVNEAKIEECIGERIVKADADFTKEVTGFAIGGIPPIGHKQPIRTLIDQDLMNHQEVWAAAGTPNAIFCIQSNNLQELTHGEIIAIY
jgi:prolyl-tRNA editing enzyme YbaK/EbsC (Cys-tRNA(Pro) deacylase)